jgi:regulation of enolase protein 1 (concanavalin A-like superfamily)
MRTCAFLAAILLLPPASEADTPKKEEVLFEEKFTGELAKDWSWIREEPKAWRIDKENGALVLKTMPGALHMTSNNSRNLLLRPLPKSDKPLVVEVYVESEPKGQYEHAGLLWYADDDNYVAVWKEMVNGKVELPMIIEKEGRVSAHTAKYDAKSVWMRLVIHGGKITTQYRPSEKEAWKVVGETDLPAKGVGRVGVMCGAAPKDAERYVRFRTFRILEVAEKK